MTLVCILTTFINIKKNSALFHAVCLYMFLNLLKPSGFFTYHPPGLTFKNSTWCSLYVECFVRISEQTATFALYIVN